LRVRRASTPLRIQTLPVPRIFEAAVGEILGRVEVGLRCSYTV
jgi:hypothetical protein